MPFASVNYGITLTSGSVQSGLIGNSAILSGNIGSGQIGIIHLASGTFQAAALSSGIVQSGLIGNYAVNANNIASGSVTSFAIASGSITTSMLASGFSVPVAVSSGSVSSGSITAGAVTSGTIAAGAVTSGTIAQGSVTSGTIAAGAVTSGTIAQGSVTSGTISAGAVTSGALSSGSVTAGSISQNAITSGTISSGAVNYTNIASGFIKAGTNVSVSYDVAGTYTISATGGGGASISGKLSTGNGLGLNSGTFFDGGSDQTISIISGGIVSNMLGSGAVTTTSIASGAITATQMGSGAVTANSIASGSITIQSFGSGVINQILVVSGGIQSGSIAPNAITSGTISSGAVTGTLIASGTITSTNIASGTITSINVASGTLTGINMASGFIKAGTNISITQDANSNYTINATGAGGASTSGKLTIGTGLTGNSGTIYDGSSDLIVSIGSGAITANLIGSGAVTSTAIASGSVTINSLASGLTTQILSVSGGIQSGAIASGSITGSTIASGTITSINIASGTITSTNIASGTITSNNVASGTLTGTNLASGTVTGTNIASGFINAGTNIYITQAVDGSYTINSSGGGSGIASGAQLVAGSGLLLNSGTVYDGSIAQTISIASGGITSINLGSGAVTSTAIASGSVTINSLSSGLITQILSVSGGIQSGAIASGSITGSTIASGTITSINIASGTITSTNIASGTITSANIASGTLTGTNMSSGTITTNNIASGAVGPYQIASGAFQVKAGAGTTVTYSDINTFTVTVGASGSAAVSPLTATSGLALDSGTDFDGATSKKIGIASGGVQSNNIASGAVTSGKIADNSITYNQMASGFLFQNDLLVNLTGGKTFGKYTNGETVPSSGKSALEVIMMALTELTVPLATISGSPRTYNFDTLNYVNTLTYSGSITTPGATLSNSLIQFRRGGTGSWTTVFSGATGNGTALHSGSNTSGDYSSIDYLYTVTDSTNNTATATTSISILSPQSPTVSLSVTPTTYLYGTTVISGRLSYGAIVNTVGASGKIALVEFRRAGAGAWSTIYSGLVYSGTLFHNTTNASGNTDSFDYQYTFVDSASMSGRATAQSTILNYTPPTVSALTASGTTLVAGIETNSLREQGNAFSNLGGSITRNTASVNLLTYQLQYNASGSWVNYGSAVAISGQSSVTVGPTLFSGTIPGGISDFKFRMQVTDDIQTTTGAETTINFLKMIYYGSLNSNPSTSAEIRTLSGKIFTSGPNPFTLATGTSGLRHIVAVPSGITVTSIVDTTNFNIQMLGSGIADGEYKIQTLAGETGLNSLNDAAGNAVPYNIYMLKIAIPYDPSANHVVTRA